LNSEERIPPYQQDDEIDLKELILKLIDFIKHVWQEQRFIWLALLITVPIGLLVAFGSQEEYTASTKILPYRSGGSAGGLGGLAGLAGVRLPTGPTEQLITVDLYPELAGTLDFRVKLAETPIRFGKLNQTVTPSVYFTDHSEPTMLGTVKEYTIGLPGKMISGAIALIRPPKEPLRFEFPADETSANTLRQYDEEYLEMIEDLGERISVRANQTQRVTTSLTIEATMPDPIAAADLVRAASENLMAAVIDYEVRKVGEEIRFLEEQYQRSEARFKASQEALAIFTDRNRETRTATAQIELQRLQSEFNLAFEIYRNFSTELEQARIKQNRDTPIFTVLESVTIPNHRTSPKRGRTLVLSIFLGVFFGIVFLAGRIFLTSFNLENQKK
jgi:LPS O-antigen subunit length determinant protein (WzzB/FepE family)